METPPARTSRFSWYILPVVVLLILAVAFLAYQYWNTQQPASVEGELISAAELEKRHGLRVHLVGVTAGGGMIDFRLKIIDPEKARLLLEEPANLPRIIVAENGYALMSPEGLHDDIEWVDGGILFNFYPNDNGIVKPGTPVIVQFGDIHLKPQPAQ